MLTVFKTDKTNLMLRSDKNELRHVETIVTYSWEYDDTSPDFDYGNEEENKKELARFESGELLNVFLKVTASCLGEIGTDTLGGCFVRAQHLEQDLIDVATAHDMKNNACIELKENILCQWNALKAVML